VLMRWNARAKQRTGRRSFWTAKAIAHANDRNDEGDSRRFWRQAPGAPKVFIFRTDF
jgi:hypothetical protein